MSEGYDVSDFSFDRCIERLETQLRNSEARNATSLEVIRAREEHVEQQRVEIDRLKREGSPGVMHSVDQAFHALTVKERNNAYTKIWQREADLSSLKEDAIGLRYAVAVCLEHFRDELAMGIEVCVPRLTEKYSELLIMCAEALGRPTMADLNRIKEDSNDASDCEGGGRG